MYAMVLEMRFILNSSTKYCRENENNLHENPPSKLKFQSTILKGEAKTFKKGFGSILV
jgi:hypothetical protein